MPASIGEPVKIISVTLTLAQIEALRLITEEENINRSEWFRQRINERMVALYDLSNHTCGGPPEMNPNNTGNIWARIGKSNPFALNKLCRACWPDGKPIGLPRPDPRYRNSDDPKKPVYVLQLENGQTVVFS